LPLQPKLPRARCITISRQEVELFAPVYRETDEYRDDDAMDAHVTNPARVALGAKIAHLLACPPQTSFVGLVAEK
jgi:hypothetical protein